MRIKGDYWLLNKPVAHRGLWGGDVRENSITAYEKAAENGYPIEIDVYASSDGKLMSFHDKTLKRMTGEEGYIFDRTYEDLRRLRLLGSNDYIPSLSEVFEIAAGKVPLLIEIKNQPDKTVTDRLISKLKNYKGEFAVQSFNPFYIKRVKDTAPDFIRGILATEDAEGESAVTSYVIKHMPFNRIIKPDFISYHYTALPLNKRKVKNIPVIAWTITNKEDEKKARVQAKNIIFEGYIPD